MDAVHSTIKKTLILLSFALLWLGPLNSGAKAQSLSTCGTVSLNSQNFQAQCSVSSTGANIAFTSAVTYADNATGWLSVSGLQSPATSAAQTIVVSLGNTAILNAFPGPHTAYITITPTNAALQAATITVNYTPGAGGGGGGGSNGAVTASALQTFCPSGCSNLQYLTLTNTSATAFNFNITAPQWISLSQYSGTINGSSQVVISVSVNNFSLATTGQSITVLYNNTSTTVSIPVSNTGGGGGGGSVSPNPGTISWSYSSSGTLPLAQPVTLTDNSGAATYTVSISNISDSSYWLILQYGSTVSTSVQGVFSGGSSTFYVNPVGANFTALSNGAHSATLTITDSNNNSTTIQVNLVINGSGTGGGQISSNPTSITIPQVATGSTSTVYTSATITSTVSGTFITPFTQSGTCAGLTPQLNNTQIIGGSAGVTLTVFGNPSGLSSQTETCYYTMYLSNGSSTVASYTLPVTWVIGSGSGGGTGGASNPVLPVSLNFATEGSSSTPLLPQLVTITAQGQWTATVTSNPSGWLLINNSSTASGTSTGTSTATISINPAGLTAQTYTGSIAFNTTAGTQTVNVTLLNTGSTPVVYATPSASFSLQAASGNIIGTSPQFQILTSDNSALAYSVTTSASWLVLSSSASGTLPGFVTVGIDPSQLANGVYSGTINISVPNAANPTLSVPVVLTVSGSSVSGGGGGSGNLVLSPGSLTFNAQVNGTLPFGQTIQASAASGVQYYAQASGTNNGITWLFVSPSSQYTTGTSNFNVTVNQTGLPIGQYTGYINFYSTTGGNQSVQVTLNVSTTGGGGGGNTVTSNPTSLTFSANQNAGAPSGQTLSISSASGSVGFTLTTTEQNGTNVTWLSATANQYSTDAKVTVNVNQSGLAAGTYTGAVVVTPTGGTPYTIPVTLVVAGLPQVTVSNTRINLSYSVGGVSPTTSVTVNGGAGLQYTASATSTCNCIAVSPNSGDTTSAPNLTVSLSNPTNLTAGNYTGTITVLGTGNATGSSTINVSLSVTAPLPTITAVVNAASGAQGPVSPGEIVTIFGTSTNPIGPVQPVGISASTLVNGNVPLTGLGGVKVTFNGYPAAIIYASATQINCVVPYEVAGFNGFPVVVNYLGQSSNGFPLQATTTVPGVFTQNGAGTGPAAILNADGRTVNGPNAAAPKGSIVSVYMTGEGATTPKGVDGQTTCNGGCTSLSQIPIPLLPVAATVDGQPAQVVFYGEAPGLVAGLMQVNIVIPTASRSGAVPIVISVGGNPSQSSATVSVQ